MKCPFCGNDINNEKASFCNMCGKKLPQSRNDYYDAANKGGGEPAGYGSSGLYGDSYDSMSYEGSRDDSYERSNDRSQDELYKEPYGRPGDGLYENSHAGSYDRAYDRDRGYVPPNGHVPPTPPMKDRRQGNILKGVAIGLSIAIFCLAVFLVVSAVLRNKRGSDDGQEAKTVESTASNKADNGDGQEAGSQTDQSDEDLSSDEEGGEYDETVGGAGSDEYEESGSDDGYEEDNNYYFPSNVTEDPSTGHHYAFYDYKEEGLAKDFDAWEHFCQEQGGHLAVISNQEENDFIYNYLNEYGRKLAFFGYTDQWGENDWEWVNGESSAYENWAPGQPNNGTTTKQKKAENYAQFSKDTLDGRWNDSQIGVNSWLFICEWDD